MMDLRLEAFEPLLTANGQEKALTNPNFGPPRAVSRSLRRSFVSLPNTKRMRRHQFQGRTSLRRNTGCVIMAGCSMRDSTPTRTLCQRKIISQFPERPSGCESRP